MNSVAKKEVISSLRMTTPYNPLGKGYKLCPGGIKVFIEYVVVETSKRAHSIGY